MVLVQAAAEEEDEEEPISALRLRRIAERDEAVGSRLVAFFWTSGDDGCQTLDNCVSWLHSFFGSRFLSRVAMWRQSALWRAREHSRLGRGGTYGRPMVGVKRREKRRLK